MPCSPQRLAAKPRGQHWMGQGDACIHGRDAFGRQTTRIPVCPQQRDGCCTMGTGSAWLRGHQNTFVSGPFLRAGVIVVSLPIWGPDPSPLPFTPHHHPGEAGVSREATLQVMKLCHTLDLAIWLLAIFGARRFLLQYFALFSFFLLFFLLIPGTSCPVQVMPKASRCLLLLLPSPTSPAPPEQQQ